jgi:ABC-type branched-subunit amino acid transport system ATPase component
VNAAPARTGDHPDSPELVVTDLRVQFGGRTAVSDLSLRVPVGTITGLIGPNGAGKTTTFNACSGLMRPAKGTIKLFARDVTRVGSAHRARLGLGRTFQRMELCDALTVTENVALGYEAARAGNNPLRQLFASPGDLREMRERTESAIERCGLSSVASRPVGKLSTGQRRLVELARAIAADFRLIMLDEPSSGLDTAETQHFGEILLGLVADRGIGMLLVEHDISLIRQVCSYIYVLDFGVLIEQGPVAQVLASKAVAAAYLGSEVGNA